MPQITLRVPPQVLETAKRVAQAFDPDIGGYGSFEPVIDGLHVCRVDVSDEYTAAFPMFKAYPEMLRQSIEQDFAQRFPDAPVPTIGECEAFCAALVIDVVECLS